MRKFFRIGLVLGVLLLVALPAFASELQVTVTDNHTLKIVNTFSADLYISNLKSGNGYVHINQMVAAGKEVSVQVPKPPLAVDFAICRGSLPGYAKESDGSLHLPVFFKK